MPIVPRAQKQVSANALPDTRQDERAPGARGMDMLANAQQNLGNTIRREALGFGEIAIRKQQEVDRLELGKIKAEWDSYVGTVLNEEERDPDYEGMNDRINKRINEYNENLKKNVNSRLSKYVDNMISYNTSALTPKLQEIYLKKQDDRVLSNAITASKQFEENGDYESAMGVWDGVTGMSEAKRTEQKLRIEKRQKENAMMETAAALGPELWTSTDGSKGDAVEAIRNNEKYTQEEKDYYIKEVEAYFIDKKDAENEIETKIYDSMYGKIRRKTGGYQALRREIDSLSGIDERTKFGLFDLLDREYKVGSGGMGGGSRTLGKTDFATYHEIQDKIDNGTLLETAPDWKTFRALYKDKLSITKLEEFGKRVYKNFDGSAADPSIKLQEASIYNKLMDEAKIIDPAVRARAIDRYNYEINEAERAAAKQNKILSYEDRAAVMQKTLAPEIVGKRKTWYGRQTDQTRRRFEIPPGAELRDGVWYFPDASGKWIPLIFEDE